MKSATQKIEITDLDIDPSRNENWYTVIVSVGGEQKSLVMNGKKFADCMSSLVDITEVELCRRARFTLSINSIPSEKILGEHEVTENWLNCHIET